jgi:hypothetical protein
LETARIYRTYRSPDGWTMKYPVSWHVQTYARGPKIVAERYLVRGAIVSDIPSDWGRATTTQASLVSPR